MATLEYTLIPTEASWEENLYHAVVTVTKGRVVTDDPLTIEALLYRGFDIVEEAQPIEAASE